MVALCSLCALSHARVSLRGAGQRGAWRAGPAQSQAGGGSCGGPAHSCVWMESAHCGHQHGGAWQCMWWRRRGARCCALWLLRAVWRGRGGRRRAALGTRWPPPAARCSAWRTCPTLLAGVSKKYFVNQPHNLANELGRGRSCAVLARPSLQVVGGVKGYQDAPDRNLAHCVHTLLIKSEGNLVLKRSPFKLTFLPCCCTSALSV